VLKDKDIFSDGDLLISVLTSDQSSDWEVARFGFWLQIYRYVPGHSGFEPIAQFKSQEAAMDFALNSPLEVTFWGEE
jgi:hypothetical protein